MHVSALTRQLEMVSCGLRASLPPSLSDALSLHPPLPPLFPPLSVLLLHFLPSAPPCTFKPPMVALSQGKNTMKSSSCTRLSRRRTRHRQRDRQGDRHRQRNRHAHRGRHTHTGRQKLSTCVHKAETPWKKVKKKKTKKTKTQHLCPQGRNAMEEGCARHTTQSLESPTPCNTHACTHARTHARTHTHTHTHTHQFFEHVENKLMIEDEWQLR